MFGAAENGAARSTGLCASLVNWTGEAARFRAAYDVDSSREEEELRL